MQNFHLSPEGAAWKLTTEDGRLTVDNFDTREEALAACSDFMDRRTGALKIHRADGTLEEERTFPRAITRSRTRG